MRLSLISLAFPFPSLSCFLFGVVGFLCGVKTMSVSRGVRDRIAHIHQILTNAMREGSWTAALSKANDSLIGEVQFT